MFLIAAVGAILVLAVLYYFYGTSFHSDESDVGSILLKQTERLFVSMGCTIEKGHVTCPQPVQDGGLGKSFRVVDAAKFLANQDLVAPEPTSAPPPPPPPQSQSQSQPQPQPQPQQQQESSSIWDTPHDDYESGEFSRFEGAMDEESRAKYSDPQRITLDPESLMKDRENIH